MSEFLEELKPGEHLLQAHVANRIIRSVNKIWRTEARGGLSIDKTGEVWAISGTFQKYCYTPQLNFKNFIDWENMPNSSGGVHTVDLIGKGTHDELYDYWPGNGMYVDMQGSSDFVVSPDDIDGMLQSRGSWYLSGNVTLELTVAGAVSPAMCMFTIRDWSTTLTSIVQNFYVVNLTHNFSASGTPDKILITSLETYFNDIGFLIKRVRLFNEGVLLFDSTFNKDNPLPCNA